MSLFRLALPRSSLIAAPRPLCLRAAARSASTASSEPIVLPRLQADLKTAMRAKNKPALNTIRSLQAEIINASKTTKPIESDFAFFMLLQKQIKAANTAMEEFRAAKREDLASKEQEQLEVLQKYYDDIPKLEESEIDATISEAVKSLEADGPKFGMIMSTVMQKLKGKTFDVEMVTSKINEVVGKK